MILVADFLSLVVASIATLATHREEFASAFGIAAVLAGICGLGAWNYSKLWNLRFRPSGLHLALCLAASILTLVFVLLFASFRYMQTAADRSIDAWRVAVQADTQWHETAHRRAYEEVEKLGIEDFSKVPAGTIPLTQNASFCVPRQTVDQIAARIAQFFASDSVTIPSSRILEFSAEALRAALHERTPRVIPVARGLIILLFVLMQLIPFGLIGHAAWRDLKVTV